MNNCNTSYLLYNSPDVWQHNIDKPNLPFKEDITTQLPKYQAVLSVVNMVALAVILACLAPAIVSIPLTLGVLALTVQAIYTHLIKEDPLVEAFYKIVGGKENFEKLPEFTFTGKLEGAADRLRWDTLTKPVLRATMSDGRKMLIIKSLQCDHIGNSSCNDADVNKTVFVFVEKFKMGDYYDNLNNIFCQFLDMANSATFFVAIARIFVGNTHFNNNLKTFSSQTLKSGVAYKEGIEAHLIPKNQIIPYGGRLPEASEEDFYGSHTHLVRFHSSITKEMANDFYAQLSKGVKVA